LQRWQEKRRRMGRRGISYNVKKSVGKGRGLGAQGTRLGVRGFFRLLERGLVGFKRTRWIDRRTTRREMNDRFLVLKEEWLGHPKSETGRQGGREVHKVRIFGWEKKGWGVVRRENFTE